KFMENYVADSKQQLTGTYLTQLLDSERQFSQTEFDALVPVIEAKETKNPDLDKRQAVVMYIVDLPEIEKGVVEQPAQTSWLDAFKSAVLYFTAPANVQSGETVSPKKALEETNEVKAPKIETRSAEKQATNSANQISPAFRKALET